MEEAITPNDPMMNSVVPEEEMMPVQEEVVEIAISMDTIGQSVQQKFQDRSSKRSNKESQWMEAMQAYLGSLASSNYNRTGDQPFGNDTRTNRTPEFNVVRTQCNTAISVLWAKQFAGGDKNWDILATPHPEMSPDMPMDPREAAVKADLMESVIDDQLVKARYAYNCRLAMEDKVILGTGIIKAPVNATETKVGYGYNNGTYVPTVRVLARPIAKRVNPWFFYPDPTATDIQKCRDAIELHPMSADELQKLKTDPSFFADAIDEVMASPPPEDNGDNTYKFAYLTDSSSDAYKNKYKVLEYHGPFSLEELGVMGLDPAIPSPTNLFYAEVWVVNGKVIRAELSNVEGCQHVPYAMDVWQKDPGSIFGIGLASELLDSQRVINTTYRMILDNSAISSGPQIIMDKTKIKPANGKWDLKPDKIWHVTEFGLENVSSAFAEFTPTNVTVPLMNLLTTVRQFAQEEGAVPFFMPGTQSAQAADTAYGTKQIMDASSTVIDYYNERWDDNITLPVIRGFYAWNMQYNPDESIKGDFDIDVRSSSDLRSAQIYLSELEKLAVGVAQDPNLAQVVDARELTKARLRAMKLPTKAILKTDEQIQQEMEAAAQQGPSPEEQKIQIEMMLAQVKQQEVQLKQQELQMRLEQEMQKAAWDHEEKMAAQYARLREAEAQVLAADSQERIEMYKLAQKSDELQTKIMADLQKASLQDQRERFAKGIDATIKFRDQALVEAEMQYAKKEGKGI